jgi:hypothetical protein
MPDDEIIIKFIATNKNDQNYTPLCPDCKKPSLYGHQEDDGCMGQRGDPTDEFWFSCETEGCFFEIHFKLN